VLKLKTGKTIAIHPYSASRLLEATSGRNFGADKANLKFFRLLLYLKTILFNFETVNFMKLDADFI
jgi:hypothetical protein